MARTKDQDLAKHCSSMATAAAAAVTWFSNNAKLVGTRRASLDRSFKKRAVEARKLALAAERPMSVGVFGASQSGKSFLIGSFIAPHAKPVKVVFGGEGQAQTRLDFLSEVNPVGGDETTGLVTRFSLAAQQPPTGEYPVVLRMLSEGDIVKVLANTFSLDLRGRAECELGGEALQARIAALDEAVQSAAQPGMSMEDVLELETYIQDELDDHPINADDAARETYWLGLERVVPYLQAEQRAKALAPLWGEIPEFTALYLELKAALDLIGHSELTFAPLDAIRDRQRGILHVGTIYNLDANDGDAMSRVTVMTRDGKSVPLRKPVITALTAELRVRLEEKPWPFFEHTDLLDFPGARGRESKTAAEFLRGDEAKPTNRAYCFLRGKIAVLFDKYSADLDLNTMLLCSDDRNQEVRKLAELIHRWVARTHGAKPEDRTGKNTALFLCLTKADLLFDKKVGAKVEDKIRNRINKDVEFYTSWTSEWTPGRAFDNLFFVRNPKFMREDLFDYEPTPADAAEDHVPPEVRLSPSQGPEMDRFKQVFASLDIVTTYVAQPAEKIDAILRVNDGGISYIADHLAPTCDPDLKYNQIAPRARGLAERMRQDLEPYFEGGDIAERVKERRGKAQAVRRAFRQAPDQLGQFLALLEADERSLGAVFLETVRGLRESESSTSRAATDVGIILDDNDDHDDDDAIFGTDSAVKGARQHGIAGTFGETAVSRWLSRLEDQAANADLAGSYGLTSDQFSAVVNELSIAARRYGLSQRIARDVEPIVQYHQRPEEHMHRVAMVSAVAVNDLVDWLGRKEPDAQGYGELFQPPTILDVGDLPTLPAAMADMQRLRGSVLSDWLKALILLAEENAASTEGGLVDVDQNRILGEIMERIASGPPV